MKYQRGFTLIELSIVLVVIGLIVGGVLAGRELMANAKANTIVTDVQEFRSGQTLFMQKYKCLPGDCGSDVATMLGNGGWAGDGNGLIGASYGVAAPFNCVWGNVMGTEMGEYWRQMKVAGFINRLMNPTDTNGSLMVGVQATYDANTRFIVHHFGPLCSSEGYGNGIYGQTDNFYLFGGTDSAAYQGDSAPVPPAYAKGIDTKLDDGHGTTGKVMGSNAAGFGGVGGSYSKGCVTCDMTAGSSDFQNPAGCGDYNLSTGRSCTIFFAINPDN